MRRKSIKRAVLPYIILGIVLLGVLYVFEMSKIKTNEFTYEELLNHIENEEVKDLKITPRVNSSIYQITGHLKSYGENEYFKIDLPYAEETVEI